MRTIGLPTRHDDTALFEGATVVFLAQLYGVDLALGQQLARVGICVLGGIGTAGVQAGSIPMVAMILGRVGVPPLAIARVLGVERFLDMVRTTGSTTGGLAAAVVVSRGEERGAGVPAATKFFGWTLSLYGTLILLGGTMIMADDRHRTMRRGARLDRRWFAPFVGLVLAAWSSGVEATPFVQSIAVAITDETGEEAGTDEAIAESANPGQRVEVFAPLRCPGTAPCAVLPGYELGSASAETDFGVNRARAFAPEAYDVNAENDVWNTSTAMSFWVDEWTFSGAGGGPVSIEFTIDGAWSNFGAAEFDAAVADSTLPPILIPDDTEPPLLDGQFVGGVGLDTSDGIAFTDVPPFFIPLADAGEPDGDVDLTLTLVFTPIPDRVYLVGARLIVATNPGFELSETVFDQTARVSRVVVPTGLTLSSTGTYQVVPEPGTAALLLCGIATLGAVRPTRRR